MNLPLDLRYSLRTMRKNSSFISLCVLVIALGIGLSITMYSLINTFAFKSLPFPEGDRFVAIQLADRDNLDNQRSHVDGYIYQSVLKDISSIESLGAYQDSRATFSDGDVAQQYIAANITPNLLQLTSTVPILGRSLSPSDDLLGADPVVLISYRLWQSYYTGQADIVGTSSRINGNLFTIVGVMPKGFNYPFSHDLWLPLQLPPNLQPGDEQAVTVMGLLANNTSLDSASAEVDALFLQLNAQLSASYGNLKASILYFTRLQLPDMSFFYTLTALTATMLLLVCLNVANLLVVRTNERSQELAIRNAMGAQRAQLISTVLLDSLLICVLGSLLGIVFAYLGMALVSSSVQAAASSAASLPFFWVFEWDFSTGVVTVLIIFMIWLCSGGFAAWQVARQDISTILGSGSSASVAGKKNTGSVVLVVFELVFSCFLLVLSGTFIGTSYELSKVDYGTAVDGYITGNVSLPNSRYSDSNARDIYRQTLSQQLLEQEGISQVSFTTALPSKRGISSSYNLEDRDLLAANNSYPSQEVVRVANNYFSTMDVALSQGRYFDSADTSESLPVVIIDALFAEQMWPGESALGKRLQTQSQLGSSIWLSVVGVTPHILQRRAMNGLDNTSLYLPLSQSNPPRNSDEAFSVVMKVTDSGEYFSRYNQLLREAAAQVDRSVPISDINQLTEVLDRANSAMDFGNKIFSNIAIITLVLAISGIYAIVSRSVMLRTKEIGIRRAIGSSNASVLWVFIRQGLKYLCFGLAIGGGAAVVLTNAVAGSFPPGLVSQLPLVFISVSLLLTALILMATYNPARQLVALEPGQALRNE